LQLLAYTGSGDTKIILHDANNKEIATSTVNSSAIGGRRTMFVRYNFSSPVDVIPGGTYHIHVVNEGTGDLILVTSTDTDLSDASYLVHFNILNDDEDWHMMQEFANLLLIGNGNHLATIDDTELYDPERLTFPKGEKVRSIAVFAGNVAISTWKGDSIEDYKESRIYFWDGVSPTYTDYITVSGQVHAMTVTGDNALYLVRGSEAILSLFTGRVNALTDIKDVGENKSVEVYPGALSTWDRLLIFGISGGTSKIADRLVYAYGAKSKDYPPALSKDFPISTGKTKDSVQIGMVEGVNNSTIFVSWKSGTDYGIDTLDVTTDQKTGYVSTLRFDAGRPNELKSFKNGLNFRFSPLYTDDRLDFYYRINNAGDWKYLGAADGDATPGIYMKGFQLGDNWTEIEFKIELSGGNDAPYLYSITGDFDTIAGINTGDQIYNG
jgi:hypothetical protein